MSWRTPKYPEGDCTDGYNSGIHEYLGDKSPSASYCFSDWDTFFRRPRPNSAECVNSGKHDSAAGESYIGPEAARFC